MTLILIPTTTFSSVSLCYSKLICKEGESGPSYESIQAVFDLQPFRPAVNLSNPTIANISFTLYAVLGVVRLITYLRRKPTTLKYRLKTEYEHVLCNVANIHNFNEDHLMFAVIKLSIYLFYHAKIHYCSSDY